MREIKFRAYNKKTKTMISSDRLFAMSVFALAEPLAKEPENFIVLPNQENYPLMQYTGLHDKQGVEIYEGDIVKDTSVYVSGTITEIVYDIEVAGYWLKTETSTNCLQSTNNKNYEVIGSIYENKELLR